MSDAFEEWYETYDRDGGELMLFNTIDLEAAWNAAVENVKAISLRAMFDEGYARGYKDRVIEEEDRNSDAKGQDLYGRGD